MSDAQTHEPEAHEGPIKTPKQLIWAVVAAFVVPVIVIILLVQYVVTDVKPAAGSDGLSEEAIAMRIQRVGSVEIREASVPGAMKTGQQVYMAQCTACHAAGLAGAPKSGDAGAWADRIKTGFEAMVNSALKGKGAMAPQGGGAFSDTEIARAVAYMANQAGGKFEEPAGDAPAPATAAAPAAAPAPAAGAPAAAARPAPAAPAAAPAAPAAAAAPAAPAAAQTAAPPLYAQACQVCHLAAVAGAPKLGDKAAWAPRLALGVDGLTDSVIKGKGAMPPKGGAATASEADIKAVVEYMVGTVQ